MRRTSRAAGVLGVVGVLAGLGFAGGCQSGLLQNDQVEIRKSVLSLYEDQLWDNLIRAKNNLPIVQIDYSDLSGLATSKAIAGTTAMHETDLNHRTRTAATLAGDATQFTPTSIVKDVVTPSFSAEQDLQLGIKGQPVTANAAVYQAYIDFVKSGQIISSPTPPVLHDQNAGPDDKPRAAFVREWHNEYYYIPTKFEPAFFALFMTTTLQRGGQPVSLDYAFVKSMGTAPGDMPDVSTEGKGHTLVFRHQLVFQQTLKNTAGKVFIPTPTGIVTAALEPAARDSTTGKQIPLRGDTRTLTIAVDTGKTLRSDADVVDQAFVAQLKNADIEVRLNDVALTVPSVVPQINPLEQLQHEFQMLRFQDQLR